jgi:hypothetical protein
MSPLDRRSFITRVLAATAAAALPAAHVAAAIDAPSESEPIEVEPDVHVPDSPPVFTLTWDVSASASSRKRCGRASFSITANADGSGQVSINAESDASVERVYRAASIDLDAEQFRPLFEGLFADHYEIIEAHELPAGCHVENCFQRETEPAPASEVARLNREQHNVIIGYATTTAREHGFDRLISADLDRSYVVRSGGKLYREFDYWYAVKMRETEPHLPAWMLEEAA